MRSRHVSRSPEVGRDQIGETAIDTSGERWGAAQMLIGFHHFLQLLFVAAVTPIAVRVILTDQIGIAGAQRLAVGIQAQPQRLDSPAVFA